MTKDAGNKKIRKSLIKNENHKLLQVKEILDKLLIEGSPLPPAVKQAIDSAREISWTAFKEQQERTLKV